MGYTHYWRHAGFTLGDAPAKFKEKLVTDCRKVCEASGVQIAYEYDEPNTPPVFTQECIRFNGHGDDGYETFIIESDDLGEFDFCKTQMKPYDLCVTACLLLFAHHYGHAFSPSSDGEPYEWQPAADLIKNVLNIEIDPSKVLRTD